jgi:hypothetical protein
MFTTTFTFRCSRPLTSGYVETQGAFSERFAAAMRLRLNMECKVALATQTDYSEPLMRVNFDSGARYPSGWDKAVAWDQAAKGYRS